jgi:hypothetical protein
MPQWEASYGLPITWGKKVWYGLTAGHILPADEFNGGTETSDLEDSDDEENDSENESNSDIESDGHFSDTGSIMEAKRMALGRQKKRKRSLGSCDPDGDDFEEDGALQNPSWTTLGSMAEASYSKRARNRDWALINVTPTQQK